MKKALLLLTLILIFTVSGSAQSLMPFSVYGAGGLTIPSGPELFKDTYKANLHGMLGVGLKFFPSMQIIPKVEIHTLGFDGYESLTNEPSLKIMLFGAEARLKAGAPGMPVRPFVLGGAGFAKLTADDPTGPAAIVQGFNDVFGDQTKFYYEVGGGMEFGAGPH